MRTWLPLLIVGMLAAQASTAWWFAGAAPRAPSLEAVFELRWPH